MFCINSLASVWQQSALQLIFLIKHATANCSLQAVQAREPLLRDYAALCGAIMQLAAYISGDAESAVLRTSQGSDENCHSAVNQAPGMLSPSTAAFVLQKGSAGVQPVHRCCCWRVHDWQQRGQLGLPALGMPLQSIIAIYRAFAHFVMAPHLSPTAICGCSAM